MFKEWIYLLFKDNFLALIWWLLIGVQRFKVHNLFFHTKIPSDICCNVLWQNSFNSNLFIFYMKVAIKSRNLFYLILFSLSTVISRIAHLQTQLYIVDGEKDMETIGTNTINTKFWWHIVFIQETFSRSRPQAIHHCSYLTTQIIETLATQTKYIVIKEN